MTGSNCIWSDIRDPGGGCQRKNCKEKMSPTTNCIKDWEKTSCKFCQNYPEQFAKVCKKNKFVWSNDLQKRLIQSNLYQKLLQIFAPDIFLCSNLDKRISKPVSYYYCCYPATKNYSANTQGDRRWWAAGVGLCKKLKIDVLSLTLIVQAGREAVQRRWSLLPYFQIWILFTKFGCLTKMLRWDLRQ